MNLHEYQSKEVFREYGIPVPAGKPALNTSSASTPGAQRPSTLETMCMTCE